MQCSHHGKETPGRTIGAGFGGGGGAGAAFLEAKKPSRKEAVWSFAPSPGGFDDCAPFVSTTGVPGFVPAGEGLGRGAFASVALRPAADGLGFLPFSGALDSPAKGVCADDLLIEVFASSSAIFEGGELLRRLVGCSEGGPGRFVPFAAAFGPASCRLSRLGAAERAFDVSLGGEGRRALAASAAFGLSLFVGSGGRGVFRGGAEGRGEATAVGEGSRRTEEGPTLGCAPSPSSSSDSAILGAFRAPDLTVAVFPPVFFPPPALALSALIVSGAEALALTSSAFAPSVFGGSSLRASAFDDTSAFGGAALATSPLFASGWANSALAGDAGSLSLTTVSFLTPPLAAGASSEPVAACARGGMGSGMEAVVGGGGSATGPTVLSGSGAESPPSSGTEERLLDRDRLRGRDGAGS